MKATASTRSRVRATLLLQVMAAAILVATGVFVLLEDGYVRTPPQPPAAGVEMNTAASGQSESQAASESRMASGQELVRQTVSGELADVCILDRSSLQPIPGLPIVFHGANRTARCVTDDRGVMRLLPGKWTIEELPNVWTYSKPELEVLEKPHSTLLWLSRGLALRVRVSDPNGHPVPGAKVSWVAATAPVAGQLVEGPVGDQERVEAMTDETGLARLASYRCQPGWLSASAAGYIRARMGLLDAPEGGLVNLCMRHAAPDVQYVVTFQTVDGSLLNGVEFMTSGGRHIRTDSRGQLGVDDSVLSELPITIRAGQGYCQCRISALVPDQTIVVPRAVAVTIHLQGGDGAGGFTVSVPWRPDRGAGFELMPLQLHTMVRVVPILLAEGCEAKVTATDAFGARGCVALSPQQAPQEILVRITTEEHLSIRAGSGCVLGSAVAHYAVSEGDFEFESTLIMRPSGDGIIRVSGPEQVRYVDVTTARGTAVRVQRKSPHDSGEAQVAGEVTISCDARPATVSLRTRNGEPVPGVSVSLSWSGDQDGADLGNAGWEVVPNAGTATTGHDGVARVLAVPGWWNLRANIAAECRLPGIERVGLFRELPARVRIEANGVVELQVPHVVRRRIHVRNRWLDQPVEEFVVQGPSAAWRLKVRGDTWQGWTHEEPLEIVVPGVGSSVVASDAVGWLTVMVEASPQCKVAWDNWRADRVRGLALVVMRSDGSTLRHGLPLRAVDQGRLWIPLGIGTRFRVQVELDAGTWTSPDFVCQAGAEYLCSLEPR